MISRFYIGSLLFFACCFLSTCRKDVGVIDNGFPKEVGAIIRTKCATPGCHTLASKDGAAGLAMETWEQLFEGDRNGAVCIPYSYEYSTLFLFTNTFPDLGAINTPTMPYNKPALSRDEMNTLISWIEAGAPSSAGKVAFADNPNRKKVYVTNQGCDVITVFDAATQLQMRYIDVGTTSQMESPHMVNVSPDGKYWYVVFSDSGTVMQKYRTSDDTKAGEVYIGVGRWNSFTISSDSKYAFAIDGNSNGRVAHIDLDNMALLGGSPWAGYWDAYGSALNANGDTLYVTAQVGNYIHKVPVSNPLAFTEVSLDPPSSPSPTSSLDPNAIVFSPDNLYYYVTCQKSNEVRVMRVSDDGLVKVINTGTLPLEMSFSKTTSYLFVTCAQDLTPPDTNLGCVDVIDYTTNTWVKRLRLNMSEPHGIAVDDVNGLVYVSNRNLTGGYHAHHASNCGGTNGLISFINLNTLEVISNKKIEVAVDPYSISVR